VEYSDELQRREIGPSARARPGEPEDGMKAVLLGMSSSLEQALARLRGGLLCSAWGMDIGSGCRISLTATLDKTNPRGIHIGADTEVSSRADILAHDTVRLQHVDTRIGERCHIGVGAVVFPGVKVGDGCIVAPGAVVMRDVAAGCVVVGNPARVVEKGIRTGKYGVRLDGAAQEGPDRQPAAPEMPEDAAHDKVGVLS
jgi:acetyltransferase-like isoleucine patch superfamily enzyme